MLQANIRTILEEHSKLTIDIAELSDDDDLYNVGLSSLTTVNVMLALEDHFDIEFEDHMLTRATFQSVNSLADAIQDLIE